MIDAAVCEFEYHWRPMTIELAGFPRISCLYILMSNASLVRLKAAYNQAEQRFSLPIKVERMPASGREQP